MLLSLDSIYHNLVHRPSFRPLQKLGLNYAKLYIQLP